MTTQFPRWRLLCLVGGTWLVCGFLSACASSRLLKEPLPVKTPDLGWALTVPGELTLEADQVIVANGAGSWVRDASWDEYVLTLKNDSQQPVEIESFDLYSAKLPAPVHNSTSREQLEAQTSSTLRALKDVGIIGGTSLLSAGAAAALAGGGGAAASTGFGVGGIVSAGTVAAIVVLPVALIGGTSYVVSRHHRAKEDKVLIEHNLVDRGFSVLAQIAPGMQLRKSAFFAITPAPTRLIVHYTMKGESRELPLDLPDLAGLHLKAPRPAPTKGSL